MSKEIKLETLQDLLSIDTDGIKAQDNKAILTRVKQLIKAETKQESNADTLAEALPYEAISVVGNRLVSLKFDLDSRVARVVDVKVDARDSKGRNHMAVFTAIDTIERYGKKQKEISNE